MGFWTKPETELHLSIAAATPGLIGVWTNWPYYLTRVERCEGFELDQDIGPSEGGRLIEGIIDTSAYRYLWLRTSFGSENAESAYRQRRKDLPSPVTRTSTYRVGPHERETHFMANAAEPYWLKVQTDAATWLRRLDSHPFAVCVEETLYAEDADGSHSRLRTYLIPRSLITIRARRPQYSEEYREQLRQRLAGFRAAA